MPIPKDNLKSAAPSIKKRGYSVDETVIITGLSRATIYRGIADGSIPSTKYKDRRIISDAVIDAIVSPGRLRDRGEAQ
jgi:hypothetical protein